jgi:CRP-like cAMP-binding protein
MAELADRFTDGGVPIEQQLAVRAMFGGFMPAGAARQLVAVAREAFIPAGKIIYEEGARCEHIHFVLHGAVELTTAGEAPWNFEGTSLIGIFDAALERAYTRTARAVSDTRLLAVKVEDWNDIIEDNLVMTTRSLRGSRPRLLKLSLALSPHGGFREPASGPGPPSIMLAAMPDEEAPDELNPFERLLSLRLCHLFERAGTQSLIRVARATTARRVLAGELVASQGDPMPSIIIVVNGEVRIERDDPPLEAAFGPTEVVGGHLGLGLDVWPFSARAAVDATVLVLPLDDLFDIMEDHFDLVLAVRADWTADMERLNTLTTQEK